jgi:hypothetical protein
MIKLLSLSAAGLLLAASSVGALAQMNSPPPSTTTMSPGQAPYSTAYPVWAKQHLRLGHYTRQRCERSWQRHG